jgi:uncharacterized protein YndB with AHSA1/START domain
MSSILIKRLITTVFEYVSTPGCLASWVAGVTIADGLPPELQGVAESVIVQRYACSGSRRSTWEVTAYEPPRALALQFEQGGRRQLELDLEVLRRRLEADAPGPANVDGPGSVSW